MCVKEASQRCKQKSTNKLEINGLMFQSFGFPYSDMKDIYDRETISTKVAHICLTKTLYVQGRPKPIASFLTELLATSKQLPRLFKRVVETRSIWLYDLVTWKEFDWRYLLYALFFTHSLVWDQSNVAEQQGVKFLVWGKLVAKRVAASLISFPANIFLPCLLTAN